MESDSFRRDSTGDVRFGRTALRRSLIRDSKEPICSPGHRMRDPTLLEAFDALAEPKHPFDKPLRIPYVPTSLPSVSFNGRK